MLECGKGIVKHRRVLVLRCKPVIHCQNTELCPTTNFSTYIVMALEVTDDISPTMKINDDSCMIGTIGMWAGVVCALIMTLSLVLPMAGVDAMDAVPEMANKIAMWGAGGLMLVGMLGWYVMLGDGDAEMGMSVWMAGAAMSLGLGAAAISQFIEADE